MNKERYSLVCVVVAAVTQLREISITVRSDNGSQESGKMSISRSRTTSRDSRTLSLEDDGLDPHIRVR